MKKCALFTLALLFPLLGQSQDWQPFPLQQRTFWENGTEIRMYYNDQVDTLGVDSFQLLFGKQYYLGESDQPCFETIADDFFHTAVPAARVDTMVLQNDELFSPDYPSRIFRPSAQPGESWTIPNDNFWDDVDSISWTCYNINTAAVLGETMEVKNFVVQQYQGGNIVNEFGISLSQNRGLVQWLPFDQWFNSEAVVMNLLGWKAGVETAGFHNAFETYFGGIQVGDIFKYHTTEGGSGYSCMREDIEERDSVIQVIATSSGITVKYQRQFRSECYFYDEYGGGFYLYSDDFGVDTFSRTFLKNDYIVDLEATPDWFYYAPANYAFDNLATFRVDSILVHPNGRTVFSAGNMDVIDWAFCDYGWVDICYTGYTLMEGVGLSFENSSCLTSGSTRRLVGYRQDEEEWGDISFLVSSSKEETPHPIELNAFPNPNHGQFRIEIPKTLQQQTAKLELFDINGKVCYSESVGWLSGQHQVNLPSLPPGMYLLRLNGNGMTAVSRVVVE